jgi:hypothetical protein
LRNTQGKITRAEGRNQGCLKDGRRIGRESRFQLIDDTDLAGTISYLPKG